MLAELRNLGEEWSAEALAMLASLLERETSST